MNEKLSSDWVQKLIKEQEVRRMRNIGWQDKLGKTREWTVDQPVVVPHKTGAVSPRGYAKGQLETVGRGTRHDSHPASGEKV